MNAKPILTLRQRVILSSVWSLAQEERMLLDRYSKYYAEADYLASEINTDHDYKDYVKKSHKKYKIFYVNTCSGDIASMPPKEKLLISIRENKVSDFYCVLILKNPKPNQLTDETPQYLVGEGVQ